MKNGNFTVNAKKTNFEKKLHIHFTKKGTGKKIQHQERNPFLQNDQQATQNSNKKKGKKEKERKSLSLLLPPEAAEAGFFVAERAKGLTSAKTSSTSSKSSASVSSSLNS